MAGHGEYLGVEWSQHAPSLTREASVSGPRRAFDEHHSAAPNDLTPGLADALKLGLEMRSAQRRYFKSRARADLLASLAAEQAFDVAAPAALGRAQA